MANKAPPTYFVIFHEPGPNWQDGVPAPDQPGVASHVEYMGKIFETGEMLMSGPFLDHSGGMVILKSQTIDETRAIAFNDPGVKTGLIKATVKPWLVPFHS